MSDHLSHDDAQAARVDVTQEQAVRYWTETLGCTEFELRVAVAEVGVDADDVRGRVGAA